MKFKQVIQVQG